MDCIKASDLQDIPIDLKSSIDRKKAKPPRDEAAFAFIVCGVILTSRGSC